MVDIMTALATASQAIKLAQELRGIDKAMHEAEFKLKIADLTGALADLKMALTEAKDDLAAKDVEIAALKRQFQRTADTVEAKGFKYKKGDDGQPKGAPYCPVCEQRSGLLMHLAKVLHAQQCPNCKAIFQHVTIYPE